MKSDKVLFAYMIETLDQNGIEYNQMKIHKLMYFAKAYELAFFKSGKLRNVEFNAWANGPVNPEFRRELVYEFIMSINAYRDYYTGKTISEDDKKAIEYTVKNLGNISSAGLSQLTHNDIFKNTGETPWEQTYDPQRGYDSELIKNQQIESFYTQNWFNSFTKNKSAIEERLNG